ncbi:fumarylacetoacetate hydrolase family protein [Rhodopirellula sp. MGV]|uniref:fumarylacetoacetate hydrolase family protein n=1 Tax=Rhodopirellula sp. MGV TaxID=2023130 RepID=UPI000B977905|nr:fumarylacetoacetate hydrolase family protein [Rhodopirellula sp. MGV]OYP36053.1 2-keto-4-pentenoate hydratase [Rhodopirellula sp. MGV]PNY36588.1 FAA hydrolase family protein [Rhodopirellula baltica]
MPLCRIPRADGTAQYAYYRDGKVSPIESLNDQNFFALAVEAASKIDNVGDETFADAPAVLLPPTPTPEKIFCIGLNYRDHAIETGAAIPTEPVVFSKFNTTLVGHGQAIELPTISSKVDYEAELVAVIGKEGKNIAADEAMQYVFGYTCGHDVSARDWQKGRPGGQWLLGKTFDTFAPVGPCVVTTKELTDPSDVRVRMDLNGETVQDSTTAQLIFDIPTVVAHLSKFVTLKPGDLIFTGTPPGVGDAKTPPVYLKSGDTCRVTVDGIGSLSNPVTDA